MEAENRINMKKLILLITVINLTINMTQAQTIWQQTFTELENSWMNAWKNKDEKTVREIIADDFTLSSSLSTGELMNKEAWIEKALHGYDCQSFNFDTIKVRVYGDTALLNVWYHQEATVNGKDWSGNFLMTDIWTKQKNGKWQVVARHASWLKK